MKALTKVSNWITLQYKEVTPRSSLYCYSFDSEPDENGKKGVYFFRWNNYQYAFDRFLARFGIMGFDKECEEYPSFITGYDGENYYNPLLMELDEYGEKVRLWIVE